ncbi:MAG: hypothetical protein ABJF11_08690 [Reichenbachiella sp.]|uniref:hypothetical protein n=1 Tax=Reichenbachiella sp. TaxID=2184521 RepID=UPI003266F3C3
MHASKLNQEATQTYSQSYAAKIADDFFVQNEVITGQQIISITPVKQVNYFVLKALFDEWQQEIKKFRSPYFDYKNEDVNLALKTLINTLSKNIQIQKEHFQPLLERAVASCLVLLYDPVDYYTHELSKSTSTDKLRELKANGKYIKLHKGLFGALLEGLNQSADIKNVIEHATIEYTDYKTDLESTEELFNRTLPLNVVDKKPIPEELPMPEPLDSLEEMTPLAEGEDDEEINNEFEPIEEEEQIVDQNLNQQYKEEDIKTLNEQYEEKEKVSSIAAVHETKSLSNLKNNININQRYMFINDLFEGHEQDYEVAMDEVENCESFDSSVEVLVQTYAKKYDWDMNSDEVKELLKVIFKRFR